MRIIAQTGVNPELALFVRRDRGITRESDLRGKMVGYLPGTFYLARVLEKQGMSFSDIHTVALQPPAMPHALQGGVIDAFVMWEPWGDQAMKVLGDKVLRLHDKTLYNFRQMFSVTKTFAQTHPDDVKALLKALLSAERYTHEHPKDAIAFLADAVKLDPVFLQKNWAEYEFKIKLDNSLVDLMKEDARFIIRDDPNFKDKSVPDYRQGIDSSFLSAVAPERVEAGF